jgi:hypothetical protein
VSLAAAGGILLAVIAIAVFPALRFQPVARDYFVSTLERRYKSQVDLGNLQISVLPAIHATGDDLVLWFNSRHDVPPMVRIRHFTFDASLVSFFRNPKHIGRLRLEGLQIHLPPRPAISGNGSSLAPRPPAVVRSAATAAFVLDEVIADGTTVEITPKDPSKDPLMFDIRKLWLRTIGMGLPMTFQAELNNPKPPGFIQCDGQFGPWNAARPVDTAISGKYTFRDADLSVFKGISGKLASDGTFTGQLDRMEVAGTTDIPDFALAAGTYPMALHTDFLATVDGTDGNTILHPVRARLGRSGFEVTGAVERGALETRKTILLDAKTVAGAATARLEDFLRLSVKSTEPPMTGGIRFDTKVKLPSGDPPVIDRLQLDGTFGLNGVKFTSADVQGKIASLSHHAQGDPNDHDPNVAADFQGSFHLHNGQLNLPDLGFTLPGAHVNLQGSYVLGSGALDFRGTAKLDATVSQMTTGMKSKMLRLVDPLFRRDGAGTVMPIVISGTRGQPSFRLDIGRLFK